MSAEKIFQSGSSVFLFVLRELFGFLNVFQVLFSLF
jgi:hypothetical protein